MNVSHGFLEGDAQVGDAPLFASYHAPGGPGPARNIAYVICLPLHLELIQSYRSMRMFAEELAAAGFHVMRIHYDGTGESVGATDKDPDRVAAWLASVRRAAAAMAAIPGVDGVGLIGVRIGAAFALQTSTQIDVAQLILWEPAGAQYGREMEILASSSPQREKGGVVAGGYFVSQETLADLGKLNLTKMQPRGTPDVLLVNRDDRRPSPRLQEHLERLGCKTTSVQLAGHKEMLVMPHKSVVPAAILAGIRDWALERSRVRDGGGGSGGGVKLATEAIVSGARWRPFWFGSNNHLFGVLTEPEGGSKAGLAAVLLLTGGVTPRTSGNGSYVALAGRLAAKGHAVLRIDVASIGESGTASGALGNGNDGFPPSVVDDARAGLDRLFAAVRPGTKVWLLGLCSGAYASFQTMLGETDAGGRTRGAFLINPVALHTLGSDPGAAGESADEAPAAMTKVDQLEQMQRYLKLMRDPESWKKVLSGKADVRHIAGIVGARLGVKLASVKERVAVRLGRAPKGLARDFDELLARDVNVNLVFSEGDPGHPLVVGELGARLDELTKKGLHVKVFAGADHNFHEMVSRGELLDWVEATIAGSSS